MCIHSLSCFMFLCPRYIKSRIYIEHWDFQCQLHSNEIQLTVCRRLARWANVHYYECRSLVAHEWEKRRDAVFFITWCVWEPLFLCLRYEERTYFYNLNQCSFLVIFDRGVCFCFFGGWGGVCFFECCDASEMWQMFLFFVSLVSVTSAIAWEILKGTL